MQAIDPKRFRNISFSNSPARVFSFGDAEALMKEYPPTGAWEGGYIRAINDPTASNAPARYRYSTSDYNINMSVAGAYEYADQSDALVPVINPADARFAIYEDYADGDFYAAYTGTKDLDLYLLRLNIRIVDLLTGEEIFSESVQSNAPPQEITWTSYHGIGDLRVVDGKYFYNDFDWGRYAAIMESSR